MPNKIAITGGIGSGKSAVCRILKERGYPVFSCDEINRTLLSEKSYLDGLCALFPTCVKDGKLQKTALAALVFSDKEALETLNAYAHPRISERLQRDMDAAQKTCFAEVPLLFESGMTKQFDGAIVVLRNKEERIRAVGKMPAYYDYIPASGFVKTAVPSFFQSPSPPTAVFEHETAIPQFSLNFPLPPASAK